MYYIQRKDSQYLETVGEFETRKEAREMCVEYQIADQSGYYYVSTRCCKDWRDRLNKQYQNQCSGTHL